MSTPEPESATFQTVFLINLVVYNPVKPSTKKTSEEKVNKLKKVPSLNIALTANHSLQPHFQILASQDWEQRVFHHFAQGRDEILSCL
jgi:hypothetical protein